MNVEVFLKLFVDFDFIVVCEEDVFLLLFLLFLYILKLFSLDLPELI